MIDGSARPLAVTALSIRTIPRGSARRRSPSSASPASSWCSWRCSRSARGSGGDAGRGPPSRGDRHAERRRLGADERHRRGRSRGHQGGAGHPAGTRHARWRLAELYVMVDVPRSARRARPPTCRCAGSSRLALQVRREASRSSRAGRSSSARTKRSSAEARRRQFAGMDLGTEFKSGQTTLKMVGVFSRQADPWPRPNLGRRAVLQGVYRRGNSYQSVLARLDSPGVVRHVQGLR